MSFNQICPIHTYAMIFALPNHIESILNMPRLDRSAFMGDIRSIGIRMKYTDDINVEVSIGVYV